MDTIATQTFSLQQTLPTLPVPPLQPTLQKYLTTLRPILYNDPDQLAKSTRVVEEFEHGIGRILHAKLVERAQNKSNWLEEYWDREYLDCRSPLPILSSYYFQFDSCRAGEMNGCRRAANLIARTLEFKQLLDREQLSPDMIRDTPLCMDAYRYLFSSCRIPGNQTDIINQYSSSSHIIVMRKNHIFSVNLEGMDTTSPLEIERTLEQICKECDTKDHPIGALTALNRGRWSHLHSQLSDYNADLLDLIQSSLFVVCLDTDAPTTNQETSNILLQENAANRWFDKSLQLVVFENGMAGLIAEHSKVDGLPCARYADFILDPVASAKNKLWQPKVARGDLLHNRYSSGRKQYKKLDFEIPMHLKTAIDDALAEFNNFKLKFSTMNFEFLDFGRDLIKKAKMSPDAFVQMALQLAYFKTYNKYPVTYESAQTKKYYHGRTEAGRSLSQESILWMQAMTSLEFNDKQRLELLVKACESHCAYMASACDGFGVDRLLLGLFSIAKDLEYQTLEFIEDIGYRKSINWDLSTSQVSSNYFNVGFGPVNENSLGICYTLRDKSILANISCFKNNKNEKFLIVLNNTLLNMKLLLIKK